MPALAKSNDRASRSAIILLMAALFVTGFAFSAVLPVLPMILQQWGLTPSQVTWHTGLMTGVYMLCVFIFAPLWGRVSDRIGRRPVIVFGLTGTAVALILFVSFHSLITAYVARALTGLFVGAVIPVATAAVGDLSNASSRAHHFAQLTSASLLGFLAGPALAAWSSSAWFARDLVPGGSAYLAVVGAAILSGAIALALGLWLRTAASPNIETKTAMDIHAETSWLERSAPAILVLIVMFSLASFEVGITLRGQEQLGWTVAQIGLLFTECSIVMILIQGLLFSLLVKRIPARWLIGSGLSAMVLALTLMPLTENYGVLLTLVVLVSAGASVVAPMITYWASLGAGMALGAALGTQTAASSLGQALGSAGVAISFGISSVLPFWIAVLALIAGAALMVATRAKSKI
ncbi:MAG: MFS transporter [Candidatus Tyrphobacter sp.]